MDWVSFWTGAVSAALAYALFSIDSDEEELESEHIGITDDYIVSGFQGRSTKLYCQTCRKQKIHKEIESNLWQCSRCKRHVDLRIA